jgi:hypothetical protein
MHASPRVRPATEADKESWIDVLLAGLEIDPQWQWRFPKRKEFPEDTRERAARWFERAMALENHTVFVAELPRVGDEELEHPEWVIVGGSTWGLQDLDHVESK